MGVRPHPGPVEIPQAIRHHRWASRDKADATYRVLSLEKGNNVGQVGEVKHTVIEAAEESVHFVWPGRAEIAAQRQAWRDRLVALRRRSCE
jgi:hypothetical protein